MPRCISVDAPRGPDSLGTLSAWPLALGHPSASPAAPAPLPPLQDPLPPRRVWASGARHVIDGNGGLCKALVGATTSAVRGVALLQGVGDAKFGGETTLVSAAPISAKHLNEVRRDGAST